MLNANALDLRNLLLLTAGAGSRKNPIKEAIHEKVIKSSSGTMKILIVDDSPVYRQMIQDALCALPYEKIFASSGREGLESFVAHKPDLIILDRIMPDLTGPEFCRLLRSASPSSSPHIIMLTGSSDTECLIEGLEAGAHDYVTKPFRDQELLARVRVGARTRELQKQVEMKTKLLEELALSDPLTGLSNRRAVEIWAHHELESAGRHGFPFWMVVADIDRFKQVNDTFGHSAGDTVLKRFAEILKANSRSSEMCGRLGGEEFVMIFTHTTKEGVLTAVERIRAELEVTSFSFKGCDFRVTSSFGISGLQLGQKQESFSGLLDSADAALYSAKRMGRNRIEMAQTVRPRAATLLSGDTRPPMPW